MKKLFILASLCIASMAWAQLNPDPKPVGGSSNHQPQARTGETPKTPVFVQAIKSKEDSAQEDQDRKEKRENDAVIKKLTGVLAVLALVQVFLLCLAAYLTVKQLRAYVFITGHTVDFHHGNPTISLTIKNTGHTPALGVVVWGYAAIASSPLQDPEKELPFAWDKGVKRSKSTIPAQGERLKQQIDISKDLYDVNKAAISRDKKAIYAYGEIRYRHFFWPFQRTTKYRFFWNGDIERRRREVMAAANEGNEAT